MRHVIDMTVTWVMTLAWAFVLLSGGCAYLAGDGAERHVRRFSLPPEAAAHCLARNAEAHSSALVSDVSGGRDGYDVAVRVRNGSPYASAHIESAATGTRGVIELNVRSSRGTLELLDALVDGC